LELEVARGLYRKDQVFQIRACERMIRLVAAAPRPLVAVQDVEELVAGSAGLGRGMVDKVQEVLVSGRYSRNVAQQADPRVVAVQLFQRVWGCGPPTAEAWVAAGCRSLEDVAALIPPSHLTPQQRIGLKYFTDFEQRIPRAEVQDVEGQLRELTLTTLIATPGLLPPHLSHREALSPRLHARVAGSYLRGRPSCGDIDFIVAVPREVGDEVPPCRVLGLLLAALRSRGLIAEGQGGHEEGPHDKSATWLGVWCGAPSPCARRLDIKVYPHQQLPTALSYFTGPAVLSRALRYWCNTPCAEVSALAAALHPRGNAFTLNDSELEVVHVHPWVQGVARRERREALGVLVACRSETELMQAVGLSYVPPHMRQLLEELVGS